MHQVIVDLGSDHFEVRREQAQQEAMAEDLRLLYVALTRAKIRCYICWADSKPHGSVADSFQSALGYLLFPAGHVDYQGQLEKFSELAGEAVQHVTVCLDDTSAGYIKPALQGELRSRQFSNRSLHTDWQMSSFSAMSSLSEYDHDHESAAVLAHDGTAGVKCSVPVAGLPAGPNFGNVIHDLLECLSFSSIMSSEQKEMQSALIRQKCTRYGIAQHQPTMLKNYLN